MNINIVVQKLVSGLFFLLFLDLADAQRDTASLGSNVLSHREALSIFAANGDSMIIRPEHLGIVNGLATVGITHNFVGWIDGFWAQPLVSSSFHVLPRLWGERISTEHYKWLPFQARCTGHIRGIEFSTTTTLLSGIRAGIMELSFGNSTGQKTAIPVQVVTNDQYNYKISLDYLNNWGFSTPKSKTTVTDVSDGRGILRVQGDYAIGMGIDLKEAVWEPLTRRFHFSVVLDPGEEKKVFFVFTIGEKEKAAELRDAILETPGEYIRQATEYYLSEVRDVFNRLPRFTSDNPDLVRFYNRSLSIFITNKYTVPEFVLNPYYGTGAVKGGCQCNYLYSFGQVREIMPLLDAQATKKHILQFLATNCVSDHYAFFPMTGEAFGPWYMVNDEKITALVYNYVKYSGDLAFLNEVVKDGKTVLDLLIESAMRLDDKSKPVKLNDYGPAGDHLELGWEFLYNHVMPDLNGRRYDNYKRVSELCEASGKPLPYLMERAKMVKKLLKEVLWNPELKWFMFADDQGKKDVRYTVQMFKMIGSEVLDKDIEDGLLSHLNEDEFLSPYGLHSMSKKDPGYDQADVDNGGGGICTSFPTLIAEFLYKEGRCGIADDILQRILWWGSRMPYLGDSQLANEIDYRVHTPLQSELGTGTMAQTIIFGIFGVNSDFRGNITICPKKTILSDELSLTGLKIRGRTVDIRVKGNDYDVTERGKTYHAKLGSPIILKN
jgi:hypothetical protein